MTALKSAYISHPLFLKHRGHDGHPECPERLEAVEQQLISDGVYEQLAHHVAPRATREQVERVHTTRLLDELEHLAPDTGTSHIDPDTYMNSTSLEAAWHAAGASVLAVELVMSKSAPNVFCAVRPPGHHAERDRAMGFCLINNVAVAAASALEDHGLKRVAIVDFDVHHGNGTENICRDDERILFCSTFQHPFYPYDGADTDRPNIINVPLSAGTDSDTFRKAVTDHWLPALNKFEPQLLIVSAGFDAHAEDQLAQFNLVDEDFAWVTRQLMNVSEQHCEGKIISCLEGGYALGALGRSVSLHVKTLAGFET